MEIVLKIIVMGDPCFLQEIRDQICTNDLSISKYENKTILYIILPYFSYLLSLALLSPHTFPHLTIPSLSN